MYEVRVCVEFGNSDLGESCKIPRSEPHLKYKQATCRKWNEPIEEFWLKVEIPNVVSFVFLHRKPHPPTHP